MTERNVGDRFPYYDVVLEVKKPQNQCEGCYFNEHKTCSVNVWKAGACRADNRSDKQDVVFSFVTKINKEETCVSNDQVNHPEHYKHGDIECIDAMVSAFGEKSVADFCRCSAFKYLWRADMKENTIRDLKKAKWYIEKEIELIEKL